MDCPYVAFSLLPLPLLAPAQNVLCAWLAVFAALSSVATLPSEQFDLKQVGVSLLFVLMTLIMNYVTPKGTTVPSILTSLGG